MNKSRYLIGAFWGAIAVASPAVAQQQPAAAPAADQAASEGFGDIVVTAQRRAERLQDVPLSVTAVQGAALAEAGVGKATDIKMVASSVDIPITNGYVSPYMRGVGSRALGPGIESPIALYVDGVYVGNGASVLSFSNVERIEVLKGPQGTLFGRNATGGLIQVVTRDPKSELGGDASVSYGNYDTWSTSAYVTGGIAEGVSADIAGYGTWQGKGYGTNLFNGQDVYKTNHDYGFRTKWLLEPSDTVQIRLAADYSNLKSSQNTLRVALGATPQPLTGPAYGGDEWDTNVNTQPLIKQKQGGVSMRVDVDLGGFSLVSTTAYRKSRFDLNFDLDLTAQDDLGNTAAGKAFSQIQKDHQFSQEIQLLSATDADSKLNWNLGLFYYNAKGEYDPFTILYTGQLIGGSPFTGFFDTLTGSPWQKTESLAPYAQATYEFLPNTRLTAGLRYTYEKRELGGDTFGFLNGVIVPAVSVPTPPIPNTMNARKATWRIALDHKFSDDVMVYASQNRGFKSGGFSVLEMTAPPYQPETLDATEVGFKAMVLDRKLRFEGAAFYYNYKDVQVYSTTAFGLQIKNGGKARIQGLEFEMSARPLQGLTLNAGYTYLDSEWKVFNNAPINVPNNVPGFVGRGKQQITGSVAGNDLPSAPHHVFNASGSYKMPIGDNSLTFNASYYYNSGYFGESDNTARQDAYSLVNASVRFALPDDRISVSLWGRNLTNEAVDIYPTHTQQTRVGQNRFSVQRSGYAPPRTYGVTVGTKF